MKMWFHENLYGHYREPRPTGPCGRFDLSCCVVVDDPWRFCLNGVARLSGTVTMEGHVHNAPIEGTLRADPLLGHELVYDFTFSSKTARYRFLGRKTFRWLNPLLSPTMMTGTVEKNGITCGDVETHFSLLELPRLLSSFGLGRQEPIKQ